MIKLQVILGTIVILCAIGCGIIAHITQSVSLTAFYVWLGILIVSRLHIIISELWGKKNEHTKKRVFTTG